MKYKWTIEIGIEADWVADGFDLHTEDEIHALLEAINTRIPYAREDEISVKVLKSPDRKKILKEQGYKV